MLFTCITLSGNIILVSIEICIGSAEIVFPVFQSLAKYSTPALKQNALSVYRRQLIKPCLDPPWAEYLHVSHSGASLVTYRYSYCWWHHTGTVTYSSTHRTILLELSCEYTTIQVQYFNKFATLTPFVLIVLQLEFIQLSLWQATSTNEISFFFSIPSVQISHWQDRESRQCSYSKWLKSCTLLRGKQKKPIYFPSCLFFSHTYILIRSQSRS